MKNGVPFHLAFDRGIDALMPHEMAAMSIVLSEFEGNEFNWHAMAFIKQGE